MDADETLTRPAGFTALVCGEPRCPHARKHVRAMDELRGAVRQCPHAVLVRAGCVFGGSCRAGGAGAGSMVLIQPCDRDRQPRGAAVLAGPLHEPGDVAELCGWLIQGLPVGLPLPAHLRPLRVTAVTDR